MELYIHIPFCVKKCDYCDFLSFASDEKMRAAYVAALVREINNEENIEDRCLTSVFVGGGTPSVLEGSQIEDIMGAVRSSFSLTENCEVTIEANPGTLDRHKIQSYRRAGINRLSLGCQSTENEELEALGRIHTYEEFLESFRMAREGGFSNINVDLMSAVPGQSLESWHRSLFKVAGQKPEHISAYSLIIEEGTPFYGRELALADEDEERLMYESTAKILKQFGYEQYEISNYSLPGRECRHNIGYWERDSYLGTGLGAASLIDNVRFSNTADMKEYLENSWNPLKIRVNEERLSREDQMEEFMFLGLRMTQGISKAEFCREFGDSIENIYGNQIQKFLELGLLTQSEDRIMLTKRGVSLSNQVFAEFLF